MTNAPIPIDKIDAPTPLTEEEYIQDVPLRALFFEMGNTMLVIGFFICLCLLCWGTYLWKNKTDKKKRERGKKIIFWSATFLYYIVLCWFFLQFVIGTGCGCTGEITTIAEIRRGIFLFFILFFPFLLRAIWKGIQFLRKR